MAIRFCWATIIGPSPRGWGNLMRAARLLRIAGAIPAWAGEPRRNARPGRRIRGHPRVGGGTAWTHALFRLLRGPSPRGRGNPVCEPVETLRIGAIPAWAGEPCRARRAGVGEGGHPRVGGGTDTLTLTVNGRQGPSPRGRGNPVGLLRAELDHGAIPAWAGEPQAFTLPSDSERGHPRVGGGTGFRESPGAGWAGPSPRGRGNPFAPSPASPQLGAIPAWAGEPPERSWSGRNSRGHPRVGGGTVTRGALGREWQGPSPRGRGNPGHAAGGEIQLGAIPAWAGEPEQPLHKCQSWRGHPRVGGGTRTCARR